MDRRASWAAPNPRLLMFWLYCSAWVGNRSTNGLPRKPRIGMIELAVIWRPLRPMLTGRAVFPTRDAERTIQADERARDRSERHEVAAGTDRPELLHVRSDVRVQEELETVHELSADP